MPESTTPGEPAAPAPPPPPTGPVAPAGPVPVARPPRAGEVSVGWRLVVALTWLGVALALAAVWSTSVQLGLSTWWLGPRGEPQPIAIRLSPFFAPLGVLLAAINNVRYLPWWGLAGSAVTATVGVIDLGRVESLAALELVIAGAGALVSFASFAGVYRAADADAPAATDDALT